MDLDERFRRAIEKNAVSPPDAALISNIFRIYRTNDLEAFIYYFEQLSQEEVKNFIRDIKSYQSSMTFSPQHA